MRSGILQNETFGVLVVEPEGKITGINRRGAELLSSLQKGATGAVHAGINIFTLSGNDSSCYAPGADSILVFIKSELKFPVIDFFDDTDNVIIRFDDISGTADTYSLLNSLSTPCIEFDNDFSVVFVNSAFAAVSGLSIYDNPSVSLEDIADSESAAKIREAVSPVYYEASMIGTLSFHLSGKTISGKGFLHKTKHGTDSAGGFLCLLEEVLTDKSGENHSGEMKMLRAVCLFSGGAAHDYNNALTAVMGNISLAKLEVEGNDELVDLLKDAETASNRIRQMTEKIALYSRGIKIRKEKSDISGVIQNTLSQLTADYRGSCTIKIEENIPVLEIDPVLISEAFSCIIENALEATQSGKGKIDVSVSREDVRSIAVVKGIPAAEGDYIKISVSDNGPGFNVADTSILFDPYYTTKQGRRGIGLALAYSILKRHRGFLSASSDAGKGAVFNIYIPLF